MADAQDTKNKNTKLRFTSASKDLLVVAVITLFMFLVSYFLNVFGFLVRLFQERPRMLTYIDEIILILSTLSISFAIFAWRRWLELKRETAQRIKLQEELLKCADTRAEAERIINRQLHSEIEQRKHDERINLSARDRGKKDKRNF